MLKIIIVEDEDIIRKGLVYTIDWLSMNCVIVSDAADGEEGLRKIIEHRPDIVITDIKMPKMDGIEMIRRASKTVEFKSIILTSYSDFEFARQAIELRACDYLLKPVDEEYMMKIIKNLYEEISTYKNDVFLLESTKNNMNSIDLSFYTQSENKDDDYVARAIKKIKNCYGDKISVESIAEEFGISASYLSRRFKDVTNHTFLDLLNRYRIQESIKLLNAGKYRVSEISDLVGFSDYKHFNTVFKRYTLMSPTGFIKRKM